MKQFIDRVLEIESLEREFDKAGPSLVVVFGRRRVGKTELMLHFIKDRGGIYFLADRRGYRENLQEFQKVAADVLGTPLLARADYDSWHEMFGELVDGLGDVRVIVLDEYPYLIEEGANEEFQKVWDTILSRSNVFLVLVGSSMGMMERGVLSRGAPLYGRRTMQLRVDRFHWKDLRGFFPGHGPEQLIETFSVLDGIPLYLKQFSGKRTLAQNLEESYLRKDAFLYDEAEFLLLEEFREPRRYFSILRNIASGKRSFGDIADGTSLDKATLSKYLSILQDLRLVVDDQPFGGEGSRLRRYRLSDNYLRFWFRYVYPNKQMVEVGRSREVLGIIRETFPEHVSMTFEDVVRDELLRRGPWTSVRPWWDRRGENEIDAVAEDSKGRRVLFAEAKWTNRPVGWGTVHDLIEKSSMVPVDRRWRPSYLVVSRSGFTEPCLDRMRSEGIGHWGLEDLDGGH